MAHHIERKESLGLEQHPPHPSTGTLTDSESSSHGTTESLSALKPKSFFGSRHVFALLGFLGLAIVLAMRVNLSIAIVDMVRTNVSAHLRGSSMSFDGDFYADAISNQTDANYCPIDPDVGGQENEGEFDWDPQTRGLILGSFSFGYMLVQIPGGILAERYGGKLFFGTGTFIAAIFTLLSPVCARIHPGLLIAARALEGIGEGATLPAMHVLLSRWVPPAEKSTLGAFVSAGMQFGTVIALPLSGVLSDIELDNGWPFVFYVPGALGVIWFIAWVMFVYDSPDVHPRIAEDEKRYIMITTRAVMNKNAKPKSVSNLPWKSILTSLPFWAILVAHTGNSWGTTTLLTQLPTYMGSVLHFDMTLNSTLSTLPYLVMWIVSNVSSVVADALRAKKVLSPTAICKLFNSIAFFLPAAGLFIAGFTGCDKTATVVILTLGTGANGAIYCGYQLNHIDLANNYAGIMMAITNFTAVICGFLAPFITGMIVTDMGSLSQWRTVFWISSAIFAATGLFYAFCATAEEQPWNRVGQKEDGGKDVHNEAFEEDQRSDRKD